MTEIKSLQQMADHVRGMGRQTRIAVAAAEDSNTLASLSRAVEEGFVHAILLGSGAKIKAVCAELELDSARFEILDVPEETEAARQAVAMVKSGQADALMKGLIGTDKFLKAVLNKEHGLLPPRR